LCVGIDAENNVVTSTNPTGGASAWTVGSVDPNVPYDVYGLNNVSCPSVSLCLTVGQGNMISTRHPAAGAAAWSISATDEESVSCPFTTLCVGATSNATGVVSYDPVAGASAWQTIIDRSGGLNAASCPTRSRCIAVDSAGNVLIGSPTPSRAQIRRLLQKALVANGRASLRSLLKNDGYRFAFNAPSAGYLAESWYLGGHGTQPIAAITVHFAGPGRYTPKLKLTGHGQRRLARATDQFRLQTTVRFAAAQGPAVTGARTFNIKR
jgi:hypothetical protein